MARRGPVKDCNFFRVYSRIRDAPYTGSINQIELIPGPPADMNGAGNLPINQELTIDPREGKERAGCSGTQEPRWKMEKAGGERKLMVRGRMQTRVNSARSTRSRRPT